MGRKDETGFTDRLSEMADGLEMAAEAEAILVQGLRPAREAFSANDRSDYVLRRVRVYNEANSKRRRLQREADDIRAILAENARLKEEAETAFIDGAQSMMKESQKALDRAANIDGAKRRLQKSFESLSKPT